MGIRLMIIELRKYNEIGELLYRDRNTRSQVQVGYRDIVRRHLYRQLSAWVTEDRDANRAQGTYNQPLGQDENRYVCGYCRH